MSESSLPDRSPPNADAEQLELKLPDESSTPRDLGLWAGVLVLLTLVAYWPSTTGSFVWRDDRIATARWLYAPGGLSNAWFARWETPELYPFPTYTPMALTAYWLEYRAGGKNDQNLPAPMAYHVASLIFLAGTSVLLWLILRELMFPRAWIVAALFALHPIHSEAVSWISEQGVALAGLFFVGSIYCYLMFIKWRERDIAERANGGEGVDPAQTWGFFSGSGVLFLLAILSDPSAVVLPAVLLLVLWWHRKLKSQDRLLITPMFLVAAALWISTADIQPNRAENLLHAPLLIKAIMLGRGLWFSVFGLVLPIGYSVLDFPTRRGVIASSAPAGGFHIFFATMVATVLIGLIVSEKARSRLGRGLLALLAIWFLLVCSSLNWFDVGRISPLTDCLAYLAIIPILIFIVAILSRFPLPGPHPQSAVGLSAVVLIILGLLSWSRTYAFESPVAMWRDVVKKDPGSAVAQAELAEQLRLAANEDYKSGNTDPVKQERADAIQHAQRAIELDPSSARPQRTLANVMDEQGDVAAALSHFQLAITLQPANPVLRQEYAGALILLGKFELAIPQLNQALYYDPSSSDDHRMLGEAYLGLNNVKRAVVEQEQAIKFDDGNMIAHQRLAELLARSDKPADLKAAVEQYLHILADKTQAQRPELWLAVAQIVERQADFANALTLLTTAEGLAREDDKMLRQVDEEIEKVKHMAATRPSTRSTTMSATTQSGPTP